MTDGETEGGTDEPAKPKGKSGSPHKSRDLIFVPDQPASIIIVVVVVFVVIVVVSVTFKAFFPFPNSVLNPSHNLGTFLFHIQTDFFGAAV